MPWPADVVKRFPEGLCNYLADHCTSDSFQLSLNMSREDQTSSCVRVVQLSHHHTDTYEVKEEHCRALLGNVHKQHQSS